MLIKVDGFLVKQEPEGYAFQGNRRGARMEMAIYWSTEHDREALQRWMATAREGAPIYIDVPDAAAEEWRHRAQKADADLERIRAKIQELSK